MKLRQLQKAAAKSLALAKNAKNRFEMLADQAKAAKELVKAVKIKFKVTRKALKHARKNARLSVSEKKQARKEFEKAMGLAGKHQRRLAKSNHKPEATRKAKSPASTRKIKVASGTPQPGKSPARQKKQARRVQAPIRLNAKSKRPKLDKFVAPSATAPLEQSYLSTSAPTFDSPEKAV
jgi:hypothetical protein